MSVGVGGKEGPAEVHGHGFLQNRDAFALLIGAEGFDLFVRLDPHRRSASSKERRVGPIGDGTLD
jgi:hypothetical protein